MNFKVEVTLYIIEGIIILLFILNEKYHITNNSIIILIFGSIFILIGIILFFLDIWLK